MAKKTKKTDGKQPDIKSKAGVFQLAGWKNKKTIPAKNDYDMEREFERINLLITVGVRKDGKWDNVKAPFSLPQFANLKLAVDDIAEQLKELNGMKDLEAEAGE